MRHEILQNEQDKEANRLISYNKKDDILQALEGNIGVNEREKFCDIRNKLSDLEEILEIISEYVIKADNLGIYVEKDFKFDDLYRSGGFDFIDGEFNYNELRSKFSDYNHSLQSAVNSCTEPHKKRAINLKEGEKEKFIAIRKRIAKIVSTMDAIEECVIKADELGIHIKKDFSFDSIYHEGGFDLSDGKCSFNKIRDKFVDYYTALKTAVERKDIS